MSTRNQRRTANKSEKKQAAPEKTVTETTVPTDDVMYRLDKPVVAIYVREDTKELLLMNAPMEQYKNEG